jgi:cytoskeleton protein RodZ
MTETDQAGLLTTNSSSAGSLLRQARVAKGMHIATLAAAIKVPQRKLELLEADQWDELPDMAFARALAQTVCRVLKVDSAVIMGLLPTAKTHRIEQLGEGLNAPFRERAGQDDPPAWSWLRYPAVWGGLLVLAAALSLYAIPTDWVRLPAWLPTVPDRSRDGTGPTDAATSSPSPGIVTETVPATVLGAPVPTVVEASPAVPANPLDHALDPNTPLELRVTSPSWIEVQDGRGKALLGRIVQPNEPVYVGGAPPLRLKIGNASATEVRFRGQRIDLSASTRDNVARLDLN